MFDKFHDLIEWIDQQGHNGGQWTQDHASEWWHDALNIITNDTHGTPNYSQTELAYTIVVLVALLVAHALIAITMIRRNPVLLFDKSLLSREIGYSLLWGVTLYVFYAQVALSIYIRNTIYTILFISALFVVITLIRENRLSSEEIEEERQEYFERNRDGNTSQRKA